MDDQSDSEQLKPLLRVLRRPGKEAEWTTMIHAIASVDSRFASDLARALLEVGVGGLKGRDVPMDVRCRREVRLYDDAGEYVGPVDLVFDNERLGFALLVELKLHSEYGFEQLPRYLSGLGSTGADAAYLMAVTKANPLHGEAEVSDDPRWLGSVRWYQVYDALYGLQHRHPFVEAAWRASLEILREQGDFGPMDYDASAITAWARRDEAEGILRHFLGELAGPSLEIARAQFGDGPQDEHAASLIMKGHTQPVWPWRNRMHLKLKVPATGDERLRVQFYAVDGKPYFTVEARYEYPKELLEEDEEVSRATERLVAERFEHGNDGWGYYWARVLTVSEFIDTPGPLDVMLDAVSSAVAAVGMSGLFDALDRRTPTTAGTDATSLPDDYPDTLS